MRLALALLAVTTIGGITVVPACHQLGPPRRLDDDLSGVWVIQQGAAPTWAPAELDLRDHGRVIDCYPLWDSSQDPAGKKAVLGSGGASRSPWALTLARPTESAQDARVPPDTLFGELHVRVREAATVCDHVSQATLRLAPGGLELGLREPATPCASSPAALRRVRLRRK
jgi:hypothetical protein